MMNWHSLKKSQNAICGAAYLLSDGNSDPALSLAGCREDSIRKVLDWEVRLRSNGNPRHLLKDGFYVEESQTGAVAMDRRRDCWQQLLVGNQFCKRETHNMNRERRGARAGVHRCWVLVDWFNQNHNTQNTYNFYVDFNHQQFVRASKFHLKTT